MIFVKLDGNTKILLCEAGAGGDCADVDGDGTLDRVPLFDDALQGYLWDYDDTGLELVQLRFYECATVVPDPTDPDGVALDTSCFQP